ncbi:MFS transporter [Microbacteriaceae bacterium K1510]|nr:MFS transporter [Microbacteriaceae bacterium K1510]
MTVLSSQQETPREPHAPPAWLNLLIAAACGLIAANVYYAQPIISLIGASIGMSPKEAGLIVTMTQVGYAAGLLLIVPLGDLLENRLLVFVILCVAVLSSLGAALAPNAAIFLIAALFIGLGSVAVQVLVPYAAHLSPEATRGRVVGNIMSGLMLGIMLARPVASLITAALSWQAVFITSASAMTGLAIVLRIALPRRDPSLGDGYGYGSLLASMADLARHTPVLQRRAFYHACLFATFSLFWTAVPLLLADAFHLSQQGIALFALIGTAAAVAAPIAGHVADRGWSKPATGVAIIAVAVSLLLGWLGGDGSNIGFAWLVLAALLLNVAVTAHFVLGQRAIFALPADVRGRLNGLYMAIFFAGGAAGAALAGWTYAQGGWSLSMAAALSLPALAFAFYLTE